jgi:hypothetical protein
MPGTGVVNAAASPARVGPAACGKVSGFANFAGSAVSAAFGLTRGWFSQ